MTSFGCGMQVVESFFSFSFPKEIVNRPKTVVSVNKFNYISLYSTFRIVSVFKIAYVFIFCIFASQEQISSERTNTYKSA